MARYFTHLLASLLFTILLVSLLVWLIDPFEYFRTRTWHTTTYFPSWQRYQNIGIARQHEYDTVIIGSSMAENFSTDQIQQLLGWRAVNLAISGSYGYEQRRILELALQTDRPRHVIWVIQWDSFARPVNFVRKEASYPYQLYDGKPLAFLHQYLLQPEILKLALKSLVDSNTSMDKAWYWGDRFKYGCAAVLQDFHNTSRDQNLKNSLDHHELLTDSESIQRNLQQNVAAVVASHPDVQFYAILPPYSRWSYAAQHKFGGKMLQAVVNFRRSTSEQLRSFDNVAILDFQSDTRITLDAGNYKDMTHYSPAINARMIEAIAAGTAMPIQDERDFLAGIRQPGNCEDRTTGTH